MGFRQVVALGLLGLFATGANAAQTLGIEKTKTGILPNGGFYGLYEVSCSDEHSASIGALSRRSGPWCVERQGELQCFSRSQEAAFAACHSVELADTDSDPSPAQLLQ